MESSCKEQSAPMSIEKIKILGAIFELSAKQPCQTNPFAKMRQIDRISSISRKLQNGSN